MWTVSQMSRISGVSVRTLHHYDAIGLLIPSQLSPAGYRLYDQAALERLYLILQFRELEFPLREIRSMLDAPQFDAKDALEKQIHLLELRKARLDRLIHQARQIQKSGVNSMSFKSWDKTEMQRYAAEAKRRWGATDAYQEYERRAADQPADQAEQDGAGLIALFAEFGALRDASPAGPEAQALTARLQQYITDHYYTCTKQILQCLGQMYTAGDSMTQNIDAAGGPGTAEFAAQAIQYFCSQS